MPKHGTRSALFGAHAHDPSIWQQHPLVKSAEAHFEITKPKGFSNGRTGWMRVKFRQDLEGVAPLGVAEFVAWHDGIKSADLHLWGEFECPVALFERMPRLGKLHIVITEPTDEDDRLCWTVGIWLQAFS